MSADQDDSKMPDVLKNLLKLSAGLPPALAYGLGFAVAVVVIVALHGGGVPNSVVGLLSLIFLAALVAFVYMDSRFRERFTPVSAAFSKIKQGLNRNTINEPLRECGDQSWTNRFGGACEAHAFILRYQDSIEAQGSATEISIYNQLLEELKRYRIDLAAALLTEARFTKGDDGKLLIPPAIETPCEEHRVSIKELLSKLQ
jgi:hypothetical protein